MSISPQLNLERCTLRAPFDGRIDQVRVDPGERVSAGTWLVGMLDPRHIEIPIEVPAATAGRIVVGAACRLTTEVDGSVAWTGRVARVAPAGNVAMRTVSVYVEVDNEDQETPLKPGLFVRAEIAGELLPDALLVPRAVVKEDAVWVLDEGVARRNPVVVRRVLREACVVSA